MGHLSAAFERGAVQQVLEKTQLISEFVLPSPDGGWLLIWRAGRLVRVPTTGGPEELIATEVSGSSCAAPSLPLCAYSKTDKNELIFPSFDPQLKQRRELGRFTLDSNFKGNYGWELSPDATEIAILEIGTGNIYLLNVKDESSSAHYRQTLERSSEYGWTADGKGLFMCGLRNGSVLLHVDLHGNAQVLWEAGGVSELWALPSSDGKHMAMPLTSTNSNVWMMEKF